MLLGDNGPGTRPKQNEPKFGKPDVLNWRWATTHNGGSNQAKMPRKLLPGWRKTHYHRPFQEVPTHLELEARLRRIKKGKAPGPDQIRSEVCAIATPEVAKLLFPILMKQALYLEEPIQARGGILIPALQGETGHHTEVESYRSLLLSNHFGKSNERSVPTKAATLLPVHTRIVETALCSEAGRQRVSRITLPEILSPDRERSRLVKLKCLRGHIFSFLSNH